MKLQRWAHLIEKNVMIKNETLALLVFEVSPRGGFVCPSVVSLWRCVSACNQLAKIGHNSSIIRNVLVAGYIHIDIDKI